MKSGFSYNFPSKQQKQVEELTPQPEKEIHVFGEVDGYAFSYYANNFKVMTHQQDKLNTYVVCCLVGETWCIIARFDTQYAANDYLCELLGIPND